MPLWIRSVWKRVWKLYLDEDLAYALDRNDDRCAEIEIANGLSRQMKELGFEGEWKFNNLHPAFCIGVAIELANKYDIHFSVGSSSCGCRAILDKDCWTRDINTSVSLKELAYYTIPKSHEEITRFVGEAHRLELAICKCLIQARIAGVI